MKSTQVLGALLMIQARKQLANQNYYLRCRHEIVPYDVEWAERMKFNVETIETFHQPKEYAEVERQMITEQLNLFLANDL